MNDLDTLKVYLHIKNEVSKSQDFQKLEHKQDRQTDRQTQIHTKR